VPAHGPQISGNQNAIGFRCYPQYLFIGHAIRIHTRRCLENRWMVLVGGHPAEWLGRYSRQPESEFSSDTRRCFVLSALKAIRQVLRHGILRFNMFEDQSLIS
jgi:hypothetical protein